MPWACGLFFFAVAYFQWFRFVLWGETQGWPDNPGAWTRLAKQHFSAYVDERRHKGRQRRDWEREAKKDKKYEGGPRRHKWTFA